MTRSVSMYMIKNPVSVKLTDSIKEVVMTFKKKNKSHLLVESKEGVLEGIVSKQDILIVMDKLVSESPGKTYSKKLLDHTSVKEIMTSKFLFVSPTDSIEYAVELLLQNEFHCLPVMENDAAVGVITAYDLLKAYYHEYG